MLIAISLTVVGCSETPPVRATSLGKTLADADGPLGKGGRLTFDLSPTILRTPETWKLLSNEEAWIVVAECPTVAGLKDQNSVFGILPLAQVTPEIKSKAQNHAYDSLIAVQCKTP